MLSHLYSTFLSEQNAFNVRFILLTNKYNFALFESLIDKITLKYAS